MLSGPSAGVKTGGFSVVSSAWQDARAGWVERGMTNAGCGRVLILAVLLAAAGGVPAAVAQPLWGDAAQQVSEVAYEPAKAAFEAMPEADRVAAQDALVWTGDYASGADGAFGRRTLEGIVSWQRSGRRPVTGMLDKASLAALVAAGRKARDAAGFAVVADPASGVRIGIPQKLLPKRNPNTIGGTRFQSADERVTLDTRAQPGSAEDLKALYERNVAIQTSGRQVTYKLLRPDFFVIAGETPGGRFYSRYAQEGTAIRGFSIGYGKALAGEFDRITVAIANSFQPFGAPASAPALVAQQPSTLPLAPSSGGAPTPPTSGQAPAATAQATFTGLAVGPRRVLAPVAVEAACRDARLDGAPGRLVSSAGGLAIYEPASPRRAVPVPVAPTVLEGQGLALFFAAGEGGRAVVAPAEIAAGGRVVAPLQDGGAGAVILDRSGAVAGMVGSIGSGRRAVAGLVPPASYAFVGGAPFREAAQGGEAAPRVDGPLGAKAAALMPALVRITCPGAPIRRP